MLGLIERNAMRYFLAVDAYSAAPDDVEKRLALWYAATQKYPRQLHDLSEAEYLKFKRMDLQRQGGRVPEGPLSLRLDPQSIVERLVVEA